MSVDAVVRRLTPDAALIAARTIAEIKHGFEHDVVEREAERLRNWLEDRSNVFFAALEGDRPVGFALGYLLDRIDGKAPMLFFYEIEVLPERRRQGIGTSLVEAMKSIARAERVAKMWVQTDPENAAARARYEQAGGARGKLPEEIYTWTPEAFSTLECP
ncbi:GNAT family N-acetyltransferase [Candidatus Bipolaricaulota bacterium]|nr:GNAT family N-acetyltransferase [Candidatus Bipolaricaulota bacterium]